MKSSAFSSGRDGTEVLFRSLTRKKEEEDTNTRDDFFEGESSIESPLFCFLVSFEIAAETSLSIEEPWFDVDRLW